MLLCRVTSLRTTWNSLTFPWWLAALGMSYVYHACTSVTVGGGGRNATACNPKPCIYYLTQNRLLLNTCMNANMQLTIKSFRQLFHYKVTRFSLIFPRFLVKSMTFLWQLSNSFTLYKWSPWLWYFNVCRCMRVMWISIHSWFLCVSSDPKAQRDAFSLN